MLRNILEFTFTLFFHYQALVFHVSKLRERKNTFFFFLNTDLSNVLRLKGVRFLIILSQLCLNQTLCFASAPPPPFSTHEHKVLVHLELVLACFVMTLPH